jgi:hypothetical protein
MNLALPSQASQAPEQPSIASFQYALVEQAPGQALPSYWHDLPLPRQPLMHQQAFAHLRDDGPWLVFLGEHPEKTLDTLKHELGGQAIQGVIRSPAHLEVLAEHLGDALLAQDPTGQTLLLRSYAPHVLPVLHERAETSWHAWLFGPITEWSTWDTAGCERHFAGTGLAAPADYAPITLDAPLMTQLAADQQALALLAELQRSAPEVFTSSCHGDRLSQVQAALEKARQSGLTHPDDHGLFAVLTLIEGQAPSQSPAWPDLLKMVEQQNYSLGHALEEIAEDE